MQIRNFNLIMMLIAGIIVAVIGMISSSSLEQLMVTLLIVLIVFFVIGTMIQVAINHIIDNADDHEREKEIEALEDEARQLDIEETEGQ